MDFGKTEEQELLLESLREAYKQADLDTYLKECDQKHVYPEKAVQVMVDNGFHLIGVPEKYGGVGADLTTQLMVCEEGARLGFPTFCWPNSTLEIEDILAFGNEEQQNLIIDIAKTGRKSFTLGFTEPQAGSDNGAMASTATHKNGKVYINGHKTFNTSADIAPYMLCMVRNYKNEIASKDMSMWLVPLNSPGITIKPLSKIGHWTTNTCEVYLDNVELEESALVGKEGNGFFQLMKNFEVERLMSTAGMIGMAQAAYDESVRYAGQRIQFGKTIGSFQLIQKKVVDMRIKLENMRNMVYHYAWDVESGRSIMISSALAKLHTAQAGFEVIDDAMQILGGIGYTNDCKTSRLWRDSRVYRIMAGTDEIMYHVAGRGLIKEMQNK
ncbi:MAG: acyl-CoA dehydrogenase [Oscillospiraceae bacterium]